MFESPLIQEIVAKETTRVGHEYILSFLEERFGPVPPDLVTAVQDTGTKSQLDKLVRFAARCPDLHSFRARMRSMGGRRRRSERP